MLVFHWPFTCSIYFVCYLLDISGIVDDDPILGEQNGVASDNDASHINGAEAPSSTEPEARQNSIFTDEEKSKVNIWLDHISLSNRFCR